MMEYLKVGESEYGDAIAFDEDEYRQHMYLLGLSGVGKSTLIANLALQLHELGEAVVVPDTKDGSLARDIASRVRDERRVVYIAPGTAVFPTNDYPKGHRFFWGLNLLEPNPDDGDQALENVVNNVMAMFDRMNVSDTSYQTNVRNYLELSVKLALFKEGATLIDALSILEEPTVRRQFLALPGDPKVKHDWARFERAQRHYHEEYAATSSTRGRLQLITSQDILRFMVGQKKTTIKLREWLDAGMMVVCNFGDGIHEDLRPLLGNLFMAQIMREVLARKVTKQSRNWRIVVDEFHELAPEQFAKILEGVRTYRALGLLAHQTKDQLKENHPAAKNRLFNAATGVPVTFMFDVSDEDRHRVSETRDEEEGAILADLARYEARLSLRGKHREDGYPRTITTLPLEGEVDDDKIERLNRRQKEDGLTTPRKRLLEEFKERYHDWRVEKPNYDNKSQKQQGNQRRRDDGQTVNQPEDETGVTTPGSAEAGREGGEETSPVEHRVGTGGAPDPGPGTVGYQRSNRSQI